MTAAAIDDRILDYGYTANTGDITGVTAGVGLSGGGTSGTVSLAIDLSEFSDVTPADGDKLLTLDSDGSTEQRTTVGALATLFAGTGLTASSSEIGVNTSQNITALTGGDLTMYDATNDGNPTLKIGKDGNDNLGITVSYHSGAQTIETVEFATASTSGTSHAGKFIFDVDGSDIVTINDSGLAATITTATQGTINHNSLNNFDANKHIDHTGVSVTAGSGLTGGGTIAATRTLNVGTGIVSHIMLKNGKSQQLSGWGYPCGDIGGGWWIGSRLVSETLRKIDGYKKDKDILYNIILKRIGIKDLKIITWLSNSDVKEFGKLASLAFIKKKHSKIASKIILEGKNEIEKILNYITMEKKILKIYCTGGLMKFYKPFLSKRFKKYLIYKDIDPLFGAYLISKKICPTEKLINDERKYI